MRGVPSFEILMNSIKNPFESQIVPRYSGFFCLISCFGLLAGELSADAVSYNIGSLGKTADGSHIAGPQLDQPGALTAFEDFSVTYSGGSRTSVPYREAFNPPAIDPFTIEFWSKPTSSDGDDAPVANRTVTGDRTGWVFFQRSADQGWNFRMYNANGSNFGWDLTGGTSTLNEWSHVVAVWNGASAKLYVNGQVADDTNREGLDGVYAPTASPNAEGMFSVGALYNGGSPTESSVDEIAFYRSALSGERIRQHFEAAASPVRNAYRAVVLEDLPMLYWQQNPPMTEISEAGEVPVVSFTGILEQSENLVDWADVTVDSPYSPATPQPGKLFFRARR